MKVRQLLAFLEMAPRDWNVMFEFEDNTEDSEQREGFFDPDEIVFDSKNEVFVLRSVD